LSDIDGENQKLPVRETGVPIISSHCQAIRNFPGCGERPMACRAPRLYLPAVTSPGPD